MGDIGCRYNERIKTKTDGRFLILHRLREKTAIVFVFTLMCVVQSLGFRVPITFFFGITTSFVPEPKSSRSLKFTIKHFFGID